MACAYRGTSSIRNSVPPGPYSRNMLGPYGSPREGVIATGQVGDNFRLRDMTRGLKNSRRVADSHIKGI